MTDRHILMTAPMVRALLDGRKTQTRPLAWQEYAADRDMLPKQRATIWQSVKPGDRLWVRERFHATDEFTKPVQGECAHLFGYQVPGQDREWAAPNIGRVCEFRYHLDGWGGRTSRHYPAIHMPRWASRLTLVVTATKMERLLDISESDAEAEGFKAGKLDDGFGPRDIGGGCTIESPGIYASAGGMFQVAWAALHSDWDGYSSPEVVALTFTVHRRNIDAMKAAA